jgi:hypothetical protein
MEDERTYAYANAMKGGEGPHSYAQNSNYQVLIFNVQASCFFIIYFPIWFVPHRQWSCR